MSEAEAATQAERKEIEDGLLIWRNSKSPFWQMRAYVPGTRRYVRQSLKTTDIHTAVVEARKRWMRLQVRVEDNLPVFEMRIEKACDLWLSEKEELAKKGAYKASVLRVAKGAIKRYLKSYFKGRPLSSIDHAEADRYWTWRLTNARRSAQPSKVTIGAELNTINQIIEWAEIKGHLKRAVVPRLKKPKALAKTKVNRRAAFMPQEMKTLFALLKLWQNEARNDRDRMVRTVLYYAVKLVYYSGMRTNDMPLLRWRDVKATWSDKDSHWYVQFFLRGKVEPRWVVVQHDAGPLLIEWRNICPHTEPDDLVFAYKKGEMPLLEQSFRNCLKRFDLWLNADGAPRSLYSLRHTAATEALDRGVPIEDLARNMRTSVQTIMDHYAHIANLDKASVLTYSQDKENFENIEPWIAHQSGRN
ncbi:integrase [Azospirillum lipoferum]|uniref:Site-specific integrase n=1 Tax=Azospirillum lipoferum TaxID=193 RepID=A0A5A9GJQ6_AZOLI|nr:MULTISPECIES: site-specific integrase [Azospirillum]KAA0593972.1 site-specific integrase [Azospirillum lipoferum]MCP1612447.1 integrase [Azospirillum lipoferum]MDW5531769.1 site-specific integrase [Azospirillum sp. NL1]